MLLADLADYVIAHACVLYYERSMQVQSSRAKRSGSSCVLTWLNIKVSVYLVMHGLVAYVLAVGLTHGAFARFQRWQYLGFISAESYQG